MASTDDEEISNGGDSEEQIDPRVLRQRERRMDEERDREVSDLIVRANEPDVYTPTLDLAEQPALRAQQDLLRRAATRPGVRRELRSNAETEQERVRAEEEAAVIELRAAVARHEKEHREFLWRTVPFLVAVAIAISIAVLTL